MDTLVPAFVAALLTQFGDRSPWLAAILADRSRRPFTIALGALFAHGAGNALAGAGGLLIGATLTPNARNLLLALALLFAALGAFWRLKAPDRLDGWQLGPLTGSFLGIFALALGDSTQFFTFVLSARGPSPWFAVVGATLAAGVVNLIAALVGEATWRRQPIRAFRLTFGVLALAGAAILAAGTFRLI